MSKQGSGGIAASAITDEVIAARQGEASLDARIDDILQANIFTLTFSGISPQGTGPLSFAPICAWGLFQNTDATTVRRSSSGFAIAEPTILQKALGWTGDPGNLGQEGNQRDDDAIGGNAAGGQKSAGFSVDLDITTFNQTAGIVVTPASSITGVLFLIVVGVKRAP